MELTFEPLQREDLAAQIAALALPQLLLQLFVRHFLSLFFHKFTPSPPAPQT